MQFWRFGVRWCPLVSVGRFKNVLKSIEIDQESLINHLGIIEAP